MTDLWLCPVCGAHNLVPAPDCRVCRTGWPRLGEPEPLEDEGPRRAAFFESLPTPVVLVVFAIALATWWEPITRPLAATTVHSGWSVAAGSSRADELRIAHAELVSVYRSLRTSVEGGRKPEAELGDRLATARGRWQIWGELDRFPGLANVEDALCVALQDMASILHEVDQGASKDRVLARLDEVARTLALGEAALNHGN